MTDWGSVAAFWMLAGLTIGSALLVVAVRNLIHAVVFLIISFSGIAGLYVTLSADFVAVSQVLIYAGAVSILILFAIMLTPRSGRDNAETLLRLPALALAAALALMISGVVLTTDWDISSRGGFEETAQAIGEALLNTYVLPFEIAAVLLLAAMVGAIVLIKEE